MKILRHFENCIELFSTTPREGKHKGKPSYQLKYIFTFNLFCTSTRHSNLTDTTCNQFLTKCYQYQVIQLDSSIQIQPYSYSYYRPKWLDGSS